MNNVQPENNSESDNPYIFRLYITGASPNSSRAVTNIKHLFEKHLSDRYELEIIDVYQQPTVAREEDIIALPLLIKKYPLPERRLIGDMSDMKKILNSIGVPNSDEV